MPRNGNTWTPPADYTLTFAVPVTPHNQRLQAATAYPTLLAPLNMPSDDGRVIVDTLGWREPPLPFMASDSEMGHGDAIHVGTLSNFDRGDVDGTEWVTAMLIYDTDDAAQEFERLAVDQAFRGVSIHMGTARWALTFTEDDGSFREITFAELDEMLDAADSDDEAEAIFDRLLDGFYDAEIAAATQVAIPAFPGSKILTAEATEMERPDTEEASNGEMTLVAAAVNLMRPPADWFANPGLDGPTALTVTDDGHVYGHLGLWNSCHTGYQGQCVTIPADPDYSLFLQCQLETDTGDTLRVGPLVVDEGHAPVAWSVPRALRHYSQTALTAAYVTVGHDDHGVWVAGAISHQASPEMAETLKRHPLSGDWRDSDGQMRLVAAVSVNAPGFAVQPKVMVASNSDTPVGLVTVGPEPTVTDSPLTILAAATLDVAKQTDSFDQRLERIERALARIAPDPELETLADRFGD